MRASEHAATEYAELVASREIVAGPYVRAAARRHLSDLRRPRIVFDCDAADHALGFFRDCLVLTGGAHDGAPFVPLPWQEFAVGSLFGWKRMNGSRRFRTAYCEQGKGGGKSPTAAGLGLYMICADGEPRAQGYVIARTSEQSLVTFRDVNAMAKESPVLREVLDRYGGDVNPVQVYHRDSASFLKRVTSDMQGLGKSGPIPHVIVVDEYHEHASSAMLDFFDAGVKNRRQPLTLIFTNAGSGKQSACGIQHKYAARVAVGELEDDEYFALIFALDEDDDPFEDEGCWPKANPSLPVAPGYDYIRSQVRKARGMPARRALVERLNFCRWTDAESPWIARERWQGVECEELPEERRTARLYVGLDLSAKTDLTAAGLVWDLGEREVDPPAKDENGEPVMERHFAADVKIWTPADTMADRALVDDVEYPTFAEQGHLSPVPGSVMDYRHVAHWLAGLSRDWRLEGVAYDIWKMDVLELALDEIGVLTTRKRNKPGLLMVPHPQGFVAGSRAGKKPRPRDKLKPKLYMPRSIDATEALILEDRIRVKVNPLLRWAVLGSVLIADAAGNRRFTKTKAEARIDPMVALAMAVGLAAENPKREPAVRRAEDYVVPPSRMKGDWGDGDPDNWRPPGRPRVPAGW